MARNQSTEAQRRYIEALVDKIGDNTEAADIIRPSFRINGNATWAGSRPELNRALKRITRTAASDAIVRLKAALYGTNSTTYTKADQEAHDNRHEDHLNQDAINDPTQIDEDTASKVAVFLHKKVLNSNLVSKQRKATLKDIIGNDPRTWQNLINTATREAAIATLTQTQGERILAIR